MNEIHFSKESRAEKPIIKKPIKSISRGKRFYWSLILSLKSFYNIPLEEYAALKEDKEKGEDSLLFELNAILKVHGYFSKSLRGTIGLRGKKSWDNSFSSVDIFPISIRYKWVLWSIQIGYLGRSYLSLYKEFDPFILEERKPISDYLYPYSFVGFSIRWDIAKDLFSTGFDFGTEKFRFRNLKDFSNTILSSWKIDYKKDFGFVLFKSEASIEFWQKLKNEEPHRYLGMNLSSSFKKGIFEQRIHFSWHIEDSLHSKRLFKDFYFRIDFESLFRWNQWTYKSIFYYDELMFEFWQSILWRNELHLTIQERLILKLKIRYNIFFKNSIQDKLILTAGIELKI